MPKCGAGCLVLQDQDRDGTQDVLATVYYSKRQYIPPQGSYQPAIDLTGDNRTGVGAGDDESIHIFLDRIPLHVEQILIVANIYTEHQTFVGVHDAYVRLVDDRGPLGPGGQDVRQPL